MNIEQDLKKAIEIIPVNWGMQNNSFDKSTNFIYKTETLEECLNQIETTGVDKNYALHRWYNYKTSIICESIFCEFGAVAEKDKYNHDVDIYIDNVPFDVKVTVYPAALKDRPYDLAKRDGKNSLIDWYYQNQSQQNRKQLLNRLYVVCDASTPHERLCLKSDFELMREKIGNFMRYIREKGVNNISITDNNQTYQLKSEIIYIKK